MERAAIERFVRERPEQLLPARLQDAGPGRLVDLVPIGASIALAFVDPGAAWLVVPLIADPSPRRAVAGDGVWRALLEIIVGERSVPSLSARCDRSFPAGPERAIDVDQSNESVVVGGRAVVKLFVRTSPGPQPAADLPAHLTQAGFGEMPTSIGALTWRGTGRDALVATAAAYLPGAVDGWDWFPALVETGLDDGALGDAVGAAAEVGSVVGRLHAALATPSGVFPEPVGTADAVAWLPRARATLHEALEVTEGPEGDRLRSLAGSAGEVIDTLGGAGTTPVMRIHGDLHVGQILRWEGGLAVSDFDGNPLAPPAERVAPDSPARDVAAMARAIDHVGRVVQRRRPDRTADVVAWIVDARAAFLDAYRANAPAGLFDERLLTPLEVAQEAHEYVYAARYLPRWRYVPDLAMPALLAELA
jgi:maltokinase